MKKFKKHFFVILFVLITILFFKPFLLEGKIPIPSDALVGMYHPFRDLLADQFPRGFPFKNFLITDPVRQQYPWRLLVLKSWRQGQIPGWNPYQFAGNPLLANFQSAPFYPLNILFFLLPFNLAWGILIVFQPLLAGLFFYFYLKNLKLSSAACFLGAFTFAFCGFNIAWLEWGTIGQTALWLPLILLATDKVFAKLSTTNCDSEKIQNTIILQSIVVNRWSLLFVFSLTSSFFAGHLQSAFYLILFSLIYFSWRICQIKDYPTKKKIIFSFFLLYSLFIILTSIQWWPTLQFIKLSARDIDVDWQKPGWFIPFQHLVQFLAPDFFGNPTTLNYWGEWNYGEFSGFIGVIPLILAFSAFFYSKGYSAMPAGRQVLRFFCSSVLLFLSFALPTPWAKLIYQFKIPFINTSQPTRLLLIVDFCLSVLAAFGLEKLSKDKKMLFKPILLFSFLFLCLWIGVQLGIAGKLGSKIELDHWLISRRNLILPSAMLSAFLILVILRKKMKLAHSLLISGLLFLSIFDLFRFGWKFTPFSDGEFIFPQTEAIKFLKKDKESSPPFRVMTLDDRLLPPNTASVYEIQEVGGYDPLYLLRFGELIAALERGQPDIKPPFGFHRIITPANYQSNLINLLNVKYFLSLTELKSAKLKLVFQEGATSLYENTQVLPRAFLVNHYLVASNKQEAINLLMSDEVDLFKTIILEEDPELTIEQLSNEAIDNPNLVEVTDYTPNKVEIKTDSHRSGFLFLSDAYYPNWQATVDGQKVKIYRADYAFRAIIIPPGEHQAVFSYSIWPQN